MAKLTTESQICRRIVRSFLEFLDSVEPTPGVDEEGLEVARECLAEAFRLNLDSAGDDEAKSISLIDMFSSLDANERRGNESDVTYKEIPVDGPSSSTAPNVPDSDVSEALKAKEEEQTREPPSMGFSKDELFGQFFVALEKIRFFRTMTDGNDDPALLDKATHIFHDAINEMERTGCQTYDVQNLAETLKCQGNRAMQSKLYSDAIELYSFAIALCENNAVFYCNRAAAYTQVNKYAEAIRDCLKSIEIDPNYSKAYSRLGLVYYAQGNYSDAIERGFKKALQLDPNNETVKENIRVAEQKLREQQQRSQSRSFSHSFNTQNMSSNSTGGSRGQGTGPSFSMPIDTSGLPADIASMLMNMTANVFPGQPSQNNHREERNTSESDEPGIRIGGNVNLDFDQVTGDLTGALRSVMEMIGGASPQGNNNQQDTTRGRPAGN